VPSHRSEFHVPPDPSGRYAEAAYFAGNSLGLQPRVIRERLHSELDDWARLGVEGHTEGTRPWVSYHELLREPAARLVGALPREVVVMNSLTVNLHLMMISFYRPTAERHAIVIEDSAFPSDSYAVRSQAAFHGYDPDEAVIRLRPRDGEAALRTEDIAEFLGTHGDRVALVLLGAVNYYSGEFLDIPAVTAAGRAAGAVVGWDLAHAAGNVPLRLHDWDVDWAAWCSYKYLNSGPGSLAGAFVHERHLADRSLPKLAGWWSTDPATRFRMDPVVTPVDSADSWQLSNPPDPVDGRCPGVPGDVRRGGPGCLAGQVDPAHRVPRDAARSALCRARGGAAHPARPATPRRAAVGAHRWPARERGQPVAARRARRVRRRTQPGRHPARACADVQHFPRLLARGHRARLGDGRPWLSSSASPSSGRASPAACSPPCSAGVASR
jgi:kynureninase